ncbi:uncharacterized protein LOC111377152 [Olea europaea var. sylvestris]|uniref:uncharacterized protein LOC111377152 n=1 Tax=Olea europaea var. sylvestris TaxID=158386 RepID=UPI000C1CD731|nr:uncharacterized protein LOC111377152 [Olea europaea var. sylvestris]
MNHSRQGQSIQSCLFKQSHQARTKFRIRLNVSIDCVRFLLQQEIAFCGHDGFEYLNNRGNFLELLHWLCDHNAEIALEKSQIDITTSSERYLKKQMSVVIRYMKNGHVLEHFIGVTYVLSTTTVALKTAIDQLFSTHSLTFVAVAQKHLKIEAFFTSVHRLVNIVGRSAKQIDLIREKQRLKIHEALSVGEISSGRGLNQETTLKHFGDICWGSYYSCLINMILMFSATVDVVEAIATDIQVLEQENKVIRLCGYYPTNFNTTNISELDDQLDTYIFDKRTDVEGLQGLSDLTQKLVAKNKHEVYPLVFKLVTLALVLPMATATVEIAFSAMTYVKNRLRNQIRNQ